MLPRLFSLSSSLPPWIMLLIIYRLLKFNYPDLWLNWLKKINLWFVFLEKFNLFLWNVKRSTTVYRHTGITLLSGIIIILNFSESESASLKTVSTISHKRNQRHKVVIYGTVIIFKEQNCQTRSIIYNL